MAFTEFCGRPCSVCQTVVMYCGGGDCAGRGALKRQASRPAAGAINPADRISRCRPFRTEGSSSTIAITASDSGLGFFIMVVGKGKVEAGAASVVGRGPQAAAVRLDN